MTINTVLTSKKSTGLPRHPAAVDLLHNQHLAPVYVDLPFRPTIPPQPLRCYTWKLPTGVRIRESITAARVEFIKKMYVAISRSQATAAAAT